LRELKNPPATFRRRNRLRFWKRKIRLRGTATGFGSWRQEKKRSGGGGLENKNWRGYNEKEVVKAHQWHSKERKKTKKKYQ